MTELAYTQLKEPADVPAAPVYLVHGEEMLCAKTCELVIARLLGGWWAAAGALVLAANPSFNEHALACDSHVAVACCLAWGLYFLVRWSQRGKLWEAFVAGLLLGCIPTIRYPEALFGLGVGVFLLMHARERKRIWLHWLVAAAGAALPLVPLMIRNQLAFGAFYRTAYALTQEQTGFGWGYFKSHFVQYVRNLNGDGVGLFFSLGVVGIAVMCCARRARRLGVLLAALAVPSTLLYMAYYWAPGRMAHSTMRFLIPTFICYAVAGLWLLAVVTDRLSPVRKLCVVGLALVLHLIWGVPESLEHTQRLHYQKQLLAQVTDALEEHTEAGDVILADNQLLQHLDFVRKWRLADPSALRPRPPRMLQRMEQDKDAPKPMQEEKLAQMAQKYEGLLPPEQELEAAKALSKWAGERKVYFVGPEYALEQMRGLMFNAECFKIVGRIKLPEPPPMEGPEGPMGRRAGRGRVAGPDRPGGEPDLPAPPGGGAMPPGAGVRGMPPGAGGVPPAGGRMGQRIHAYTREYVIAEWTYDPKRARRRRGPGQFLDEHLPRPWRRTPRFRDRQRR